MNDLIKKQRFHTIVMPHLSSAFNLARWLSHGHQEAEDIVQEAFLRAFKYFDGFHGDDGRVWLLGIVRNTFYTWYQQNKIQTKSTPYEDELYGLEFEMTSIRDKNNPETKLIQKNSQRLLNEALCELPIEFREVMVMRELEDLSYKQIAELMQIPMGTVMSRLGRGRKQLATILLAKTENGGAK